MPYRTTIQTDAGRITFMERCLMQHGNDKTAGKPLISDECFQSMSQLLPQFKGLVEQRGKEAADRIPAVEAKDKAKSLASLWISHFFQVFHLWIKRDLHDDGLLKYYATDMQAHNTSALYTDDEVLLWGDRLLKGEVQRTAAGGAPMANPSAAQFQPIYDDYKAKLQAVQKEKMELDVAAEAVDKLRPAVDEAIGDAVAELEFNLRKKTAPGQRRVMRLYGVTYTYRPGEAPEEETTTPDEPVETPA